MRNLKNFISLNKRTNFRILLSTSLIAVFGAVSLFLMQPMAQMQDASPASTSKKPRTAPIDTPPSNLNPRDQELADKAAYQNQLKLSLPSEFDLLKSQAPALTQMLTGTIAANAPTFNRPLSFSQGGTCGLSGVGTAVHYKAVPFTLSCMSRVQISLLAADGATVTPASADTYLILYGPGGFNPANACANAITANDDSGSPLSKITTATPLAPGNYTAVVTTFDNEPGDLPYTFSAVQIDTCGNGGGGACTPSSNIIQDGGFEANGDDGTNFFWNTTSTAFDTSLCTLAACGTGGGSATPRTGNGWTWFDGTGDGTDAEDGSVSQSVTIPTGATATLNYYLRVGAVTAPSTSTLKVQVDGMTVQTITEPAAAEAAYTLRTVNLSAFANGASHVVSFVYNRPAGTTGSDNFTIDDVSLAIACAAPTGADLSITNVDTPDTVAPGNIIVYTFLLTNKGPAAANNVTFRTVIPTNTTYNLFLQSDDPGLSCTTPVVGGTGSVNCTIASLPVGTRQFKLRVVVNPGTPVDTIITSRADVTLTQTDPTPLDNTSITTTRVGASSGGVTPPARCLTKALDYDGDRRADFGIFRPSTNFVYINSSAAPDNLTFTGRPFGDATTDFAAPGDYDGDGKTDLAVWRSTNGVFYVIRSSDNTSIAVQFGQNGDQPVARDYDGDCKTDFAVVRKSGGVLTWYILNSGSNNSFRAEQFGSAADVIAPGDYDGDGKSDLAVFRGTGDDPATFFVKQSRDGFTSRQFGLFSDLVVPGDYDGDGKTDFAVVRTGTAFQWYVLRSSDNQFFTRQLGGGSDFMTQADYDGDGKTDVSVFRPQTGIFYVIRSSDNGLTQRQFGQNGDYPIANYDTH